MEGGARDFGVHVLALAACPEGSDNKHMGCDNKLSRSSTLVNLQDV